jgi:hypothetical protein
MINNCRTCGRWDNWTCDGDLGDGDYSCWRPIGTLLLTDETEEISSEKAE